MFRMPAMTELDEELGLPTHFPQYTQLFQSIVTNYVHCIAIWFVAACPSDPSPWSQPTRGLISNQRNRIKL